MFRKNELKSYTFIKAFFSGLLGQISSGFPAVDENKHESKKRQWTIYNQIYSKERDCVMRKDILLLIEERELTRTVAVKQIKFLASGDKPEHHVRHKSCS